MKTLGQNVYSTPDGTLNVRGDGELKYRRGAVVKDETYSTIDFAKPETPAVSSETAIPAEVPEARRKNSLGPKQTEAVTGPLETTEQPSAPEVSDGAPEGEQGRKRSRK